MIRPASMEIEIARFRDRMRHVQTFLRPQADRQTPRLDAREVEQIADQAVHAVAGALDRLDLTARAAVDAFGSPVLLPVPQELVLRLQRLEAPSGQRSALGMLNRILDASFPIWIGHARGHPLGPSNRRPRPALPERGRRRGTGTAQPALVVRKQSEQ